MLAGCPDLREVIRLEKVSHFTSLEKAAKRLLVTASFNRRLATTIERAKAYRLFKPRAKLGLPNAGPLSEAPQQAPSVRGGQSFPGPGSEDVVAPTTR